MRISRPCAHRENLTVLTHALTTRVLVDGARAVGVEYRHRGRDPTRVEAGCVILAGGAINSPQLLMLSGIGPADHLREHGIAGRVRSRRRRRATCRIISTSARWCARRSR